ncbi:MAG TPA: hypothetical protein H9850_00020 [Candidatus Anaerobiospirillum pullistercoris]|uniref:Uncharacterized protein n=1 Tax=Candidatus Anaerobiospirillum pullistercoris TaxID=2838452 RepID=A0A9D1WB73_9GAMM|nr:hypothetical protein [Candidatus Anaerobiospirillum pullistercoris]
MTTAKIQSQTTAAHMLVAVDSRSIVISAIAINLRKGFQKLADYDCAALGIDIYQDQTCCVAFINKTG